MTILIFSLTYKYNTMVSCFKLRVAPLEFVARPEIKLMLCEGTTRVLKGRSRIKAGEIMFKFPDCVVCHADSFILGRPIPILGIHDKLVAGHAYFVIPLDGLPSAEGGGVLSASSLSSLGTSPSSCPSTARLGHKTVKLCGDVGDGNKSPFEYVKDKEGRTVMIKVIPEFIMKVITNNYTVTNLNKCSDHVNNSPICSTPELQKQYEKLVKPKDQVWSPKLEPISEHSNIRFSPCRVIGLERKYKDK